MQRKVIILASLFLTSSLAMAYQVTGPVLEVTATKIVVQKGSEKWEISRDANTKMKGDAKVGDKVTVEYKMSASSIEVKGAAKAKGKK